MGTTFFCKIPFVGWVGQILVNFVLESKLYFLGTNGTQMVPKFFRDEKYVFWAFNSCIARMRMTSRSICRMFENLKILSNFCKQIDILIFQNIVQIEQNVLNIRATRHWKAQTSYLSGQKVWVPLGYNWYPTWTSGLVKKLMKLIEWWPQMCFYTRKWYPNGTQILIFTKYKV